MKIENFDTVEILENVNRVEVIDEHGRSYVHYNAGKVEYSIQDNGRTLKIFIESGNHNWKELVR